MTLTCMVEYELARGNRPQAARQLTEVERLIGHYGQNVHAAPWQGLLKKYHRSLVEDSTTQAAADVD